MDANQIQNQNVEHVPINFNETKTSNNLIPKKTSNSDDLSSFKITKTLRRTKTRKIVNLENQEKIKRIILNEFGIQEKKDIKTFEYSELMKKNKMYIILFWR